MNRKKVIITLEGPEDKVHQIVGMVSHELAHMTFEAFPAKEFATGQEIVTWDARELKILDANPRIGR